VGNGVGKGAHWFIISSVGGYTTRLAVKRGFLESLVGARLRALEQHSKWGSPSAEDCARQECPLQLADVVHAHVVRDAQLSERG